MGIFGKKLDAASGDLDQDLDVPMDDRQDEEVDAVFPDSPEEMAVNALKKKKKKKKRKGEGDEEPELEEKKSKEPTQLVMNLAYKPDNSRSVLILTAYICMTLCVVFMSFKFMVYDVWVKADKAESKYNELCNQRDELETQIVDYDATKLKYVKYVGTDKETATVNRIDAIETLEDIIGNNNKGLIDTISITGNTVTIAFSSVTLKEAGDITKRLEESDMIGTVTIASAAVTTDNGGVKRTALNATIVMNLPEEARAMEGINTTDTVGIRVGIDGDPVDDPFEKPKENIPVEEDSNGGGDE